MDTHPWAYPRRAGDVTQRGIQARGNASRNSASRRATKNTAGRRHLTAFSGSLNVNIRGELPGGRNVELLIVFRKLFTDLFPGAPEPITREDPLQGLAWGLQKRRSRRREEAVRQNVGSSPPPHLGGCRLGCFMRRRKHQGLVPQMLRGNLSHPCVLQRPTRIDLRVKVRPPKGDQ